jgi:hypothetical protein
MVIKDKLIEETNAELQLLALRKPRVKHFQNNSEAF